MAHPTLLVLAAGMGSRYGGLKALEPVGPGGETIIDYSIYDAHRAGFGKVVFVIRRSMEPHFKQVAAERFGKRVAVEFVHQEIPKLPPGFPVPEGRVKPWGTTHAILLAANAIHDPFAVINVNDFYGAQSYRVLAQHLDAASGDYAMVGFILRNTLSEFGTVARGVCEVSENGFLEKIVEHKSIERDRGHALSTAPDGQETRLSANEVVSMNMWGFTPQVFELLRAQFLDFLKHHGKDLEAECLIPSTVNELLMAGKARVKVLRSVDAWFGLTYHEDHARAVENIRHLIGAGHYPRKLWA